MNIAGIDHKILVISSVGALAAWTGIVTYKYYNLRKSIKENVYETPDQLHQYLIFHYGKPEEILKWEFGPKEALDFPKRCADICIKYYQQQPDIPNRALDIGCAVGRSSFELTRAFNEVHGIDFSQSFVQGCCQLKEYGEMVYSVQEEGEIVSHHLAEVDKSLDRSKTVFSVGDACNLPLNLGQFGCVLGANLVCRLPTPKDFLARLASLVAPGGIAVLTCPYTFMPEFTPRRNMFGGYMENGKPVTGFDGLNQCLSPCFELVAQEDMPFLIRETGRKNQWTVAHCTVWRRKRAA